MVETKRLGDIATYINGYAFKPDDWCEEGLPIIRIQDLTGTSYQQNYYKGDYPAKIEINDGDVLISWSASLGVHIWNRGKALLNQHIFKVVFDKVEVDKQYFVYAVQYNLENMLSKMHGATMKHIVKKDFDNIEVPFPTLAEQKRVASILTYAKDAIEDRKQQLAKLDNLVKSRFVEMFGDPIRNSKNFPTNPMTNVCEIIDGDRGKNYPTQEDFLDEGYCLFLNAKNVTSKGFSFKNCTFITKEKDEMLKKGHLNRGDVILTTRGTIGNLAFYDEFVPYENIRINSGMVILRMNHGILLERFFIEQFKMQLGSIKEKIASGSAQPQLPISTMNKIVVLTPPTEQQKLFVDFVQNVDKLKVSVSWI